MPPPIKTGAERIIEQIQEVPGFYQADNSVTDYGLRLKHLLAVQDAVDAEVRMCSYAIARLLTEAAMQSKGSAQ